VGVRLTDASGSETGPAVRMKAQRRPSSNVAPLGNGAVGIERTMFLHKSRSYAASQSLLFITFILLGFANKRMLYKNKVYLVVFSKKCFNLCFTIMHVKMKN